MGGRRIAWIATATWAVACGDSTGSDDASAWEPTGGATEALATSTDPDAATTFATTLGSSPDTSNTTGAGPDDDTTTTGPPPPPPTPVAPCDNGDCWDTLTFTAICGGVAIPENFGSGAYNVHQFALFVEGGTATELTLARTAGTTEPMLVVHDEAGATIYDGENGTVAAGLTVTAIDPGWESDVATVRIESDADASLTVFATAWEVADADFTAPMPTDFAYGLTVANDCEPTLPLVTPPNFDPNDIVGGYHLLPESDPPGLYTKNSDACSRGNQLLIEALYTFAVRWAEVRPEYSPIAIRDLNDCPGGPDHATHDDGTHADIVIECGTDVGCANFVPAIDIARLFIHTGEVCGIIFDDGPIQDIVNPYFESMFAYDPWHGTFMRTVGGHTAHMHVRVRRPDGTCFPT